MSRTSVDFPEPETPATATRRPSGKRTVRFLRLCCRAPTIVIAPSARRNGDDAAGRPTPASARRPSRPTRRSAAAASRRRSSSPVAGRLHAGQRPRRALEEQTSAEAAGAGAEVDHVVGGLDRLGVVLDDDDGVAAVGEPPEDGEQPPGVDGVQPDRRLVEHVERAGQRPAERRGEADALRLAARERARRRARASGSRGRRRSCSGRGSGAPRATEPSRASSAGDGASSCEEALQVAQREVRELRDRAVRESEPRAPEAPDARPAAAGAGRVRAVPREQHPDVDLVALGLEPVEEALDAVEVAAALDQDLALVGREAARPGRRCARSTAGRRGRGRRTPTRRPACSRARPAARESVRRGSGIDLLQVHADDAPEALAGRTRAERRVEREERRRRIAELAPAARDSGARGGTCADARVLRSATSSVPARENAVSTAEAISGRDGFADDEAPDDERQAAPRRRAAARPSSPISTVSPSGESARKNPAR